MPSLENLSRQLLVLMGGPDNIISVTHCATRLRPVLKDRALVKTAEIDALDGVTGVVNKEAGLQIIIGTNVGEVYDAFMKVWQADDATSQKAETETSEVPSEKRSWFNGFVALVVSIFSPLLPLLAGAGLLRGFTILANEIGWLPTESSTNVLLTLAATSVFYFLPLLIAVTSAKRFATSPYIAMAIMGALIMPDFIGLVKGDGGNTITFLGIAIPVFNYTSQIIPAILTTWLQSKMELFMKKKYQTACI
ncbi:EIIBCA-Bgl [Listeria grayi]|uniref:EIIBCA-Bgl n=1 Tax=Listeria grayi TaxID=1641 RepID=A0A378MLF0_LISGR|nr:EIIBCA-Bgl [Listeria grayi]